MKGDFIDSIKIYWGWMKIIAPPSVIIYLLTLLF